MTTLDRVFVINKDGQPLSPTKRFAKVRRMLDDGQAKIHCYEPFTIIMCEQIDVEDHKNMKLGIDVGSLHIGLEANDGREEHLKEQIDVLEDESRRIAKRREARRTRRHYTTEHRKPRFDNRRRQKGWLPPSIRHKLDVHVDAILDTLEILPIKEVTVEVPCFDTHRMVDPDVRETGYENGPQRGFKNVRDYVLERDGRKCRVCGRQKGLQAHHIESRISGGDSPGNLVTLCDKCHAKYHVGEIVLDGISRAPSLKHATQATVIGAYLIQELSDLLPEDVALLTTDGIETALIRESHGIEKSHIEDARIIAGGEEVTPANCTYRKKKLRRHNRHYFKANLLKGGRRKRNTGAFEVRGFRRFDVVMLDGRELCWIDGLRSSGYFKLRRMDGSLVVTSKETSRQRDSSVSWRRLKLKKRSSGYLSWKE